MTRRRNAGGIGRLGRNVVNGQLAPRRLGRDREEA